MFLLVHNLQTDFEMYCGKEEMKIAVSDGLITKILHYSTKIANGFTAKFVRRSTQQWPIQGGAS